MDKVKNKKNGFINNHLNVIRTWQRLWLMIMMAAMSTTAVATTTISYYHNDHLGTPQVLTDEDQNIVWQASYDPFGKANITTETVINNVRFPGQYFDQETNLHYNYFRTYDQNTGRYITSDPIGLRGGVSTYGYANQNPIILIDPTGEGARAAALCAVIAGVGVANDLKALLDAIDKANKELDRIAALNAELAVCTNQSDPDNLDPVRAAEIYGELDQLSTIRAGVDIAANATGAIGLTIFVAASAAICSKL